MHTYQNIRINEHSIMIDEYLGFLQTHHRHTYTHIYTHTHSLYIYIPIYFMVLMSRWVFKELFLSYSAHDYKFLPLTVR